MFRGTSIEYMCEQLERNGYDRHGRVKLHNGFTGEEYEGLAFMGPTYYQRLRHMARDKDHARSRGPVQMLSRQPTEGRARATALRRPCTAPRGPDERKRACTEEGDTELRYAGEMAREWRGTHKGRGVTSRWTRSGVAAHARAAVLLGDRVRAVNPFELRISRGHPIGMRASTSVLRSGPAGTMPPGFRGNRAPK